MVVKYLFITLLLADVVLCSALMGFLLLQVLAGILDRLWVLLFQLEHRLEKLVPLSLFDFTWIIDDDIFHNVDMLG